MGAGSKVTDGLIALRLPGRSLFAAERPDSVKNKGGRRGRPGKLPLALAYQLCWDALWGAMLENVLVASSTARRDLSAIARLS